MDRIYSENDLFNAVEYYGVLPFWSETGFSSWELSGVNFTQLWNIRENLVNTKKIAYGKFFNKKATFVSLTLFPYLCALRRDGYDFDSLTDEGIAPRREIDVMNAVGNTPTPSYALGKALGMKGYDAVITSLQNKTYLALTFKKSYMGTALLAPPEALFGEELVRSAYALSPEECASKLILAPGLKEFDDKTVEKNLSVAVK